MSEKQKKLFKQFVLPEAIWFQLRQYAFDIDAARSDVVVAALEEYFEKREVPQS